MAKRKSTKKPKIQLTKNQIEEQKQLKRIRAIELSILKKGGILPVNYLPEKPSRVTKKYLEELKKIKPKTLKKIADAPTDAFEDYFEYEQALKNREKMDTSKDKDRPSSGQMSYANFVVEFARWIEGVIDQKPSWRWANTRWGRVMKAKSNSATKLKQVLEAEVEQYGEEAVGERIAQYGEEIANLEELMFEASDGTQVYTVEVKLYQIITGKKPSNTERGELGKE